MTDEPSEFEYDFFVSRRGTVGGVATEVASVLEGAGYRVRVQDYDFGRGGDFVGDVHDALVSSRHLVVLHTADYDRSYWTRKEFTNFLAALPSAEGGRRICVLRCDHNAPRGLLENVVYGDLVDVTDPKERADIILATARGEPLRARHQPPVFGGAMPARNGNFTGRAALLEAVHASLAATPDEPTALTQAAVHGLGGVGKTSLAREYVHRFGPNYTGVWWLAAETRGGLVAGLAALAARLDPKLAEVLELEKAARAALARVERSERPFLLVYDNVPATGVLEGLVPARGARVLLTTRWADWGGRAREVLVEALEEDEAVEFLQTRAGRHDPAGARRLALDLGCLPLALDHAGAYVKLAVMSFGAYAERVENLIAKAPKGALYPASVAATFDLAIASAVQECAAAEQLLAFFAFLAPERIPLDLADGTVLPEDERSEALMALTAVSLVRPDPVTADGEVPSVSVHRLVQAVTRLAAPDAADAMLETVVSRLAGEFPVDAYYDVRSWPECERLLPHVLALREQARRRGHTSSPLSGLLDKTASFLHRRGSLWEAEPLLREALAAGERVLGREHPDVLQYRSNLALLLRHTGRHAEAEPLIREALATGERVLGREHPDVLRSRNNLANLVRATDRHAEAEPLYREALAAGERVLGREHPHVLIWRHNLANLLCDTGRRAEAEPLYREALTAGERVLGREHPDVLQYRSNLALLLRDTGRRAEAEPLIREALAAGERVLGREHPDVLQYRSILAHLLCDTGRHAEAEPLIREALAAGERVLGREHPDVLRSRDHLTSSLRTTGRHAEAEPLYRDALAAGERVLGCEHPHVLRSRDHLAYLLHETGRHAEAEPLIREALAAGERVLGREHPDVPRWRINLAHLQRATGRLAEAEPLIREVLATGERVLGREHPDVLNGRNNLAILLHETGRLAEAEPLYRDALAAGERVLGREHPDVPRWRHNLAILLHDTGRLAEAEPLYRDALTTGERVLGREHPNVLMWRNNLATLLHDTGRHAEAEPLYRDALTTGERVLGREHPNVLMWRNNLANLLCDTDRLAEAEPLYRDALAAGERVLGREHPDVLMWRHNLATLLRDTGRHAGPPPEASGQT